MIAWNETEFRIGSIGTFCLCHLSSVSHHLRLFSVSFLISIFICTPLLNFYKHDGPVAYQASLLNTNKVHIVITVWRVIEYIQAFNDNEKRVIHWCPIICYTELKISSIIGQLWTNFEKLKINQGHMMHIFAICCFSMESRVGESFLKWFVNMRAYVSKGEYE